jgi:hypothetical protein
MCVACGRNGGRGECTSGAPDRSASSSESTADRVSGSAFGLGRNRSYWVADVADGVERNNLLIHEDTAKPDGRRPIVQEVFPG